MTPLNDPGTAKGWRNSREAHEARAERREARIAAGIMPKPPRKLTHFQRYEIWLLKGRASRAVLAARFGVSACTVTNIWHHWWPVRGRQ